MAVSTETPATIDLLTTLENQNHYQRLGLRTNAVTTQQIHAAHANRMQLLRECQSEVTEEISAAAAKLISVAYDTLRDEKSRREYDQSLQRSQRWKGNAAPQSPAQPRHEATGAKRPAAEEAILARYEIGKVRYEGQRSTIYNAMDTRMSRPVVIKRMRAELCKSPDYARQFREEAEQFARFTSGHLVKVLDYDAKSASIVMEQLRYDLRELVKPKGIAWKVAFGILADCLEGLCELHEAGMYHARIDLSHVLIDAHGGAKLTLTPGMRRGSQSLPPGAQSRHLAPELLNPTVFGEPGPHADMYSLGFVILELLVGPGLTSRISKAIRASENDPSTWLQWHASPTDHLPAMETLVPGVPAAYAEILGRMTSKPQHERYASAAECLQTLRDMQGSFATDPQMPSEISAAPHEEAGVDLLGQPAPLHGKYEMPQALSWAEIIRNPSVIFREDAGRHRMALFAAGGLAAMLLLVLGMQSSGEAGTATDFASGATTASPEEPLNLGDYTDFDVSGATSGPPEDDSAAGVREDLYQRGESSEDVAQKPSRVTFAVQPHGRVTNVTPKHTGSASVVPTANAAGVWQLPVGVYSVHYEVSGNMSAGTTEIVIPANNQDLNFVLQVTEVEKDLAPPVVPAQVATRELPSAYKRPEAVFPVFATGDLTSAQLSRYMRNYLQAFPFRKETSTANLEERARSPGVRDPRVSFIFALQAERAGNHDLAVNQCVRALKDARHFNVPFVLPLELLCHIELKRGGKGLQIAHAACWQTAGWMHGQSQLQRDEDFKQGLEHLAWWTGTVVGFLETTRSAETLGKINVEPSKLLFRDQLGGRHAELFDGAVQRIERRHQEFLTGNQKLVDYEWNKKVSEQQRMFLHDQYERYLEQSEEDRQRPDTMWTDPASTFYGDSLADAPADSKTPLELADESGSRLLEHLENQPRRTRGVRVAVSEFSSYEGKDLTIFAGQTLRTIPEPDSPNAKPVGTIASN